MINVPESVQHGTVKMHVISGSADSKVDDDLRPDAAPVNGTIILKPTVSSLKVTSATPPTTMLLDTLRCPIIEGVLYPPGTELDETETTLEGVILVSSDQPATQPTSLQWQATFDLSSTTQLSPITFNVPVDGVIDLTTVIPAVASPGTVNVITTETADRAEASAATSATNAATSAAAAQDARDTTLAAAILELRGTGFPGSTTETNDAPVGTYYTDTAGTAGAWRWLKKQGTDTSGWKVISGDTGLRDVSGILENGWARGNNSPLYMRRVGDQVTLYGLLVTPPADRDNRSRILPLPAGFRGPELTHSAFYLGSLVPWDGTRTNLPAYLVKSGTTRWFSSDAAILAAPGTLLTVNAQTWPTGDPWPSVLPGTPA